MIPEKWRLFSNQGELAYYEDKARWYVVDWDTHRWITAEGPLEVFEEEEDMIRALLPYVDDLTQDITKVVLSETGQILQTSSDPKDDCAPVLYYPIFTEDTAGKLARECLKRSQLKEKARLHMCVDLVTTQDVPNSENSPDLLVFKYRTLQDVLELIWNEAFLLQRLQILQCPHVVPFHKFIIDDTEPRLLGFTTKFIPGGALDSLMDSKHPFRKNWLLQLISFVDYFNLKLGLMHQDIAARNILVDPITDILYVIDFGYATTIESKYRIPAINDVDGVLYTLYEILTDDYHFRDDIPPQDRKINDITSMEEWTPRVCLEPGLEAHVLKSIAVEWAKQRHQNDHQYYAAMRDQSILDCPKMPSEHPEQVTIDDQELLLTRRSVWHHPSYQTKKDGKLRHLVHWERCPSKSLPESGNPQHLESATLSEHTNCGDAPHRL